jgi:SM-20-related protein
MCLEGSDGFVTSTAAPIATGWSDPVAGWELHPLKTNTFARCTFAMSLFSLLFSPFSRQYYSPHRPIRPISYTGFSMRENRLGHLTLAQGLRGAAREVGKGGGNMSMLNLAAFGVTEMCREPFHFLVVPGFVKAAARVAINADFPRVDRPGSFPLDGQRYGPAFAALIDELRGDAVREAFEEKFGIDLKGRPTMLTVRGRCSERDGQIHTDSSSKLITVLIYMNPNWEEPGGRLRLLRSHTNLDDFIIEVPPDEGTLVTFRRSHNSWHGHKPFIGPRRVIQMNWVTSERILRYETKRHRISAALKKIWLRAS